MTRRLLDARTLLSTVSLAATLAMACTSAQSEPTPMPKKVDLSAYKGPQEVAIVAGGCFWGMENVMRKAPGVLQVEVGYAGGASNKVDYEQVSSGDTGHAESVRIVFDPSKISYADLLTHWYFRGHDPTTVDRQNNDVGTQYRSEIFTTTPDQAKVAREVKAKVDASGKWKAPIVTKIEPVTTWVRAEEYHQDYLIKNPHGYNDHFLRDFDF